MNETDILSFARASAEAAFAYQRDYPSLQEAIDGYRDNIRDTLNEHRLWQHEAAAWAVYDAEVAKRRG